MLEESASSPTARRTRRAMSNRFANRARGWYVGITNARSISASRSARPRSAGYFGPNGSPSIASNTSVHPPRSTASSFAVCTGGGTRLSSAPIRRSRSNLSCRYPRKGADLWSNRFSTRSPSSDQTTVAPFPRTSRIRESVRISIVCVTSAHGTVRAHCADQHGTLSDLSP